MNFRPGDSERTKINRYKERSVGDRDAMYEILDSTVLCHVGMIFDEQPVVLPMAFARVGDEILLHGSTGARFMRALEDGAEVCVTVTKLDGIVVARSNFDSSMNYRSVVVFGRGRKVSEDEKIRAFDALSDGLIPGRVAEVRKSTKKELAATSLIAISLDEASVKVRAHGVGESDTDEDLGVWAGVIPLRTVADEPLPADAESEALPLPASISNWIKNPKA
jgi:nitroimidazol reductase NimA-like FMN-containing flavoprotein (pyridoxamine 5'-phosphate oxidase superfamily)